MLFSNMKGKIKQKLKTLLLSLVVAISISACVYIDDSKDSYVKAGDDCVRFFFSVMNSFDKGFTHRLSGIAGKKWSRIDTNIFHRWYIQKVYESI